MGIAASIGRILFQNETKATALKPPRNKKALKERAIEWKKVTDAFEDQVLDPSFVELPIRWGGSHKGGVTSPVSPGDQGCLGGFEGENHS